MTKQPSSPKDIPGSEGIRKPEGFEGERRRTPNVPAFEEAMEKPATTKGPGAPETQGVTPMEIARGKYQTAGPTFDSLLGQLNTANTNFNELQNNLRTPNLKFKSSHEKLLKNKLQDANNNIRSASEKIGANMLPMTQNAKGSSPVTRFLSYVTDGQNQLVEAQKKLQELKSEGTKLNPAELMLVQVKLAQAQQSLEYSSVLLSKVVDAIKQTLNIQI